MHGDYIEPDTELDTDDADERPVCRCVACGKEHDEPCMLCQRCRGRKE